MTSVAHFTPCSAARGPPFNCFIITSIFHAVRGRHDSALERCRKYPVAMRFVSI